MDIFYHWKDFALDVKEGRIGTLGSDGVVLEQLKERLPRKVWTFATPKGKKGRLQLIGSFLITESKPASFVPKWKHNLFYDVASPRSVLYTDSDSPEKIDEVSDYFNRQFNATGKFTVHGEKGIREMEADVVRGFEKLVQGYPTLQLMDGLTKIT
ncbi:hypothetical protein SBC1_52960 (plasmid) [Caballeronia sp. SBC1]|uniref:hypothetical protein n=1 Tax=unclassified Caballeronia TaxID=2646786 RepID=UPI0013E1C30E|nr:MULTISPECIES: hypothetical protein [unclassified Caballeronia]QIE27268.1 hypothetical protein SBC2_53380 [Caballeronia sp. SBC2]QIN65251.1 hypothetical protein SBC1_52960 [Caballeronia sp. SBC1]